MKRLTAHWVVSGAPWRAALCSLICLGFHTLLTSEARAGAYTWEGLGSSNDWTDTTGNWDGPSNYPGSNPFDQSDTAYFGPATQSSNTFLQGGTIVLSTLTYAAPGYSLVVNGSLIPSNGISATATNAPNISVGFLLALGGTSTIRNLTGSGQITNFGSGSTIVNLVGPSSAFDGTIDGNIALNVSGSLRLNGANSSTGNVTVQTGGKLGGTGTVSGAVTVQSGATLAPVSGAGQFTLASGLTMDDGSFLEMDFTSSSLYDQLSVQGTFAAGGTLNLLIGTGYVPVYGTSFTIFNGATPGFDRGSFLITTNLAPGLSWDTSALAGSGVVSIVPEPSTWIFVTVGLGALLILRRRAIRP